MLQSVEKETSNTKKQSKNFLQYSTMAFQMFATILIGVYLGKYIDEKFDGNGLYMALISLLFVFLGMYMGVKDLINPR